MERKLKQLLKDRGEKDASSGSIAPEPALDSSRHVRPQLRCLQLSVSGEEKKARALLAGTATGPVAKGFSGV